jgi:outer membrane protein W
MSYRALVCVALSAMGMWSEVWSNDGKNVLRFGGTYVMPTGDLTEPFSFTGQDLGNGTMLAFDGAVTFEPQAAPAFTIGYEHRFNNRLGFDFTVLHFKADVDGRLNGTYWINDSITGMLLESGPLDATEEIGHVPATPLMVGVDFHLLPKAKVDLYATPILTYVLYGDFDLEGDKVSLKPDFGYGAALGLDVPAGSAHWFFNGALRYLSTTAELDQADYSGDALEVNPFMIQVAAGYRF